ncbi:hypothetical protein RVF83_20140 [Gordonia rubripertincta]|uniref:Uncharacterized protein n=2 Tax=Gordonia rubripertincta TaxID=36822 RepID=A0AAW6R5V7_GORRU|nr:hypothetical protein [Gordonia rubripertincta]MDG6779911.1 hypothetical protein [Gordonia rubripertincta]NKY61099.1 hypothetical protein [Gordonia rubripertincta]NKY62000.1 hypothetical protein [Gordonia rubripertincta]GAB85011.1 hypothetical protein GORBP_052_00120 [Gordonia rubripertincta NBRC 101908]
MFPTKSANISGCAYGNSIQCRSWALRNHARYSDKTALSVAVGTARQPGAWYSTVQHVTVLNSPEWPVATVPI